MTQDDKASLDKTLAGFRAEIDAIDDKIIELLTQRIGVIGRVGEFKRANWPGQCPVRAGREADMVRRIMHKFKDTAFDPVAAAAIWRILIGSSTCVETPLTLSVYAPSQQDTLYWLAREYFGPTLPVTRQPHAKRVIGDVMDGKVSIGIVPFIQSGEPDAWWTSLMGEDENVPKIFACVPFVLEQGNQPAALAIAKIKPESTGDDLSLIALDTDHNVSQHRLQTALGHAGLTARWVDISSPNTQTRRHLIEVKPFIDAQSKEFKSFLAELGPSVLNAYYLGAYATPVLVNSKQPVTSHAISTAQA